MTLTLERQAFTVEPLSPVLGASIVGWICASRCQNPRSARFTSAFVRYHVLCFRDQHLDQEQQIAFTEQFGTLERHIASNRGTAHPLVHIVTIWAPTGNPAARSPRRVAFRQIVPPPAFARDDSARAGDAAGRRRNVFCQHDRRLRGASAGRKGGARQRARRA